MRDQPLAGWLLWGGTIVFYMYQYLLRSEPAAMHHAWSEEFHITASQFASIGAIYLYAYGLLQIPFGWIVDRLGVKRILIASMLLCVCGAVLLTQAQTFLAVQLSRLCLGIGSATPFICSMKIIQDQFPARRQPLFCGLTLTIGIVGAMSAGLPLQWMVERWGWRSAAEVLAWIGSAVFIAVCTAFWHCPTAATSTVPSSRISWKEILRGPIVRYALITIGLYAPLAVVVDMWGVAFLSLKYGVGREQIAAITMLGYLGLAVGSVALPWLAKSQHALHQLILVSLLGVGGLLGTIVWGDVIPLKLLAAAFFLLGFLCGSLMLCYPAIGIYTTPRNSGYIFGFANSVLMLGEGGINYLIGMLIDYFSGGNSNYAVWHYEQALGWALFPLLGCCSILAVRALLNSSGELIKEP